MSNIEDRLDKIEKKLDALLAAMKSGGGAVASGGARSSTASASSEGDIDADIDGPRGDPEVRFKPNRWTGTDYKGQKFSACEPEFLDMLADSFEWFAKRDDEQGATDKNGNPKSRWGRLDAARARAWAARLREGSGAPPPRARASAPASNNRRPSAPQNNGYNSPDFGSSHDNDDIPF